MEERRRAECRLMEAVSSYSVQGFIVYAKGEVPVISLYPETIHENPRKFLWLLAAVATHNRVSEVHWRCDLQEQGTDGDGTHRMRCLIQAEAPMKLSAASCLIELASSLFRLHQEGGDLKRWYGK